MLELLGDRKLDPENELVIKRAIHTTADFDYADNLVFSDHAVTKGIEALRAGCDIVTDTQMAKAGINKTILASLGGEVHCFMSDPDVAAEAKARGVVGHIGITAHLAAVFEAALDIPEIETIMFPYNIVEQQGKALIDRCAAAGKAFIDMKPLAGGAIENAPLAMRFIASNKDITVNIPGMASEDELKQNVAAACDPTPISEEELREVQNIRDTLGNQFCRRCNYCAPCTVGISIPSVFLFQGYLNRYGLQQWGRERYATLQTKAGACIQCGACEPRCPYNLPIRKMMKKAAEDFGE